MRTFATLFILAVSVVSLNAQPSTDDKLFEALHGHGSFNAVFVILLIILLGILFLLFRIDRKVSRMEKENNR